MMSRCVSQMSKALGHRLRQFSSQQEFATGHGNIKVNLSNPRTIGIAQSRGERPQQEDTYAVHSLQLPTKELRKNLSDIEDNKEALGWRGGSPSGSKEPKNSQVAFFAVYDGHGGDQVSNYLRGNLHQMIEEVSSDDIVDTVNRYKGLGGFFRRFKGGLLSRIATGDESDLARFGFATDQRATMAFMQADLAVFEDKEQYKKSGAVATTAFLHSLDAPPSPFFASSLLSLTVAHVGDTRALLCRKEDGAVRRLTTNHHPDSHTEAERLRRVGTGIVTDSFGETRLGGGLANSRGVGDRAYKKFGVTAEPEITKRILKGPEWSFLVIVSDGVSAFMSDQEIVDLCRGHADPGKAAKAIVSFAEQVGSDDNITALVVPLPGWAKTAGNDASKDRRKFRIQQNSGNRARRM